jgi:hypothetical protein
MISLATWIASTGILYFLFIFPLILLYPRFSWARTATSSGFFTKFPLLHKTVLNTSWARNRLFRRYAEGAIGALALALPKPYIPQSLFAEKYRSAQALARNPQDLALLAEVVEALGTARVPTHRAELYSESLKRDGSLRLWVVGNDPRLAIIYGLAFRMIAEQRVLQEDQLRDWIAAEPNVGPDDVVMIVKAVLRIGIMNRLIPEHGRLVDLSNEGIP